ncbi:hypothetical protein RV07_GL003471 [Enterococcus malodoratus]|nr:hypothetical protein RV07_GL003471 [Enterococcus malodoratus]
MVIIIHLQKNVENGQKKWLNENESHYHLRFLIVGMFVSNEEIGKELVG